MSESPEISEKAINPADVRLAAMNYLARREHSLAELRQKLSRRFADESVVEVELQRLVEENLQSDERFTESFIRQRISRGNGPVKIAAEARRKGIPPEQFEQAMEQIDVDWAELARQTLEKKFGPKVAGNLDADVSGNDRVDATKQSDMKEKARRVRFMQYRGFLTEHFVALLDAR